MHFSHSPWELQPRTAAVGTEAPSGALLLTGTDVRPCPVGLSGSIYADLLGQIFFLLFPKAQRCIGVMRGTVVEHFKYHFAPQLTSEIFRL